MSQHTVRKKPRKHHKFRFQLLHEWLTANYKPCKAADIGGGKGLLAFLLNQSGWDVTVIDPFDQILPHKFKDLDKGKRVKLTPDEMKSVKRITEPFQKEMAKDFDLLIGLHAHGSNMKIIEAAKEFNKSFLLLPCCVIDEPIEKVQGIDWLESLVEYGQKQGFDVKRVKLNFKGQDIAIYSDNTLWKK